MPDHDPGPATAPVSTDGPGALSPPGTPPLTASHGLTWPRVVVVLVASLLLGGLTSFAQGFLPDAVAPFANSASGWTLLTAVLVGWSRARTAPAAVFGAASFVLLVLGYSAAADLRGYFYDPVLFGVVGLVVGPVVGAATAWLRADGVRAALATAVLAGIGVGEAVYGLTTVLETTGATYWVAIGVAGLVLLAGMLARRLRGVVPVAVATVGTALVATAFVVAYRALGTIG